VPSVAAQLPFVTHLCTSSAQSRGVARAELRAPGTDGLVRDSLAPLGQQLLDVTQVGESYKDFAHIL
jgi:hypothetical protein